MKHSREHKEVQGFFLGSIILLDQLQNRGQSSQGICLTRLQLYPYPHQSRSRKNHVCHSGKRHEQPQRLLNGWDPVPGLGKSSGQRKPSGCQLDHLLQRRRTGGSPPRSSSFRKNRKPNDTGSIGRREERRKEGGKEGRRKREKGRKKGGREGGRNGLFPQHPSY